MEPTPHTSPADGWLESYFVGSMDPSVEPLPVAESPHAPATGADWEPFVVGTPCLRFEPRPPRTISYRPDTLCDGWSTDQLTVRLASVRGYAHRHDGRPREDDAAAAYHQPTGTVVFAVADGVSSASQAYIGATLVCRAAIDDITAQLDDGPEVDLVRTVRSAAWQLVARGAGGGRAVTAEDSQEAERRYATTLVAGTVGVGRHGVPEVSLVQVGDSGAWVLHRCSGRFERLLRTKDSTGEEVLSSAVTPLPRVPTALRPTRVSLRPDSVLLVGSDGFGDPLGDGAGEVAQLFAHHLRTPPPIRGIAHLLDFSRETFDDDRTLLAVWPRHLLPGDGGE
ncbi:protein phosphatase 2C domain-containing protein [Streptomyces silvisoli]|uniref:Protein phosphatase 2C domain-containing protein n=1 Tax=Streptomyces silvisoli TaxID=3034235 RepID=A0ABT5ZLL3_9ACTN|nr:protein phosphatase 2C domain-containing protein [Streptomyces silvisoli]MDF3290719.1 protein phosphatase 2C domain-containing protein [Streptomyces silvisoli]